VKQVVLISTQQYETVLETAICSNSIFFILCTK